LKKTKISIKIANFKLNKQSKEEEQIHPFSGGQLFFIFILKAIDFFFLYDIIDLDKKAHFCALKK
jgi:hypothetical protein